MKAKKGHKYYKATLVVRPDGSVGLRAVLKLGRGRPLCSEYERMEWRPVSAAGLEALARKLGMAATHTPLAKK